MEKEIINWNIIIRLLYVDQETLLLKQKPVVSVREI